ncbi:hypothetical protein H2203_003287 [Taxawa tesnikishii (nom. ined.)]|nr:hypothetical protein H2203_003287 [Dothideales sp. JES 119]
MRKTYEQAKQVLVLDAELQCVQQHAKSDKILVKLLLSGWRQRLWTLQEGALAKRIDVELTESTAHIDELIIDQVETVLDCSYMVGVPIRKLLQKMLRFQSLDNTRIERMQVQDMLMAFKERTTSRKGDETICFATFLDLDPTALLIADEPQRMVLFLKMLPFVPDNILFASGPRLPFPGFRWAPATLLPPYGVNIIVPETLNTPSTNEDGTVSRQSGPLSTLRPDGLQVTLPGLRITRHPLQLSEVMFLILPNGEVVGAVNIRTDRVESMQHQDRLAFLCIQPKVTEGQDRAALVSILDEGGVGFVRAQYCCDVGLIALPATDEADVADDPQTVEAGWMDGFPTWVVD